MRARLLLFAVVLLCGATAAGAAQRSRKGATHTVTIDGMQFTPAALTIKAGDTVVWMNKDLVAHTATAVGQGFNSRVIPPGKSWKHTFTAKGDLPYGCNYHPTMKGTVNVR